jgi:hypothetical protein
MRTSRRRQGGWIGLLVILLALLVVAWLAKDALLQYGGASGAPTRAKPVDPAERSDPDVAGNGERADPVIVAPAPAAALNKAREIESILKEEAAKRADESNY